MSQHLIGPLTFDFKLDIIAKSKPVLSVDDLLLLLNYHQARDTTTFPIEQQRVGNALILLLLFSTECWHIELVNTRKRTGGATSSGGNYFRDDSDCDFSTNPIKGNFTAYYNSGSCTNSDNALNKGKALSRGEPNTRHFNELYYDDVRLLIICNPNSREQDVLTIEVKLAYYKGYNRHLMP